MACGNKVLSERQFRHGGACLGGADLWHANMPNVRMASRACSPRSPFQQCDIGPRTPRDPAL